ncbi:MAG: hypothetical protein EBS53_17245 [Bacteroidetes bacterium]|nr:hypothetical protein [Bacteroidota bacterium]
MIRALGGIPGGWSIEENQDRIQLETREHGSVYNETAGAEDVAMGRRILGILRKAFPENKSEAEVVDEWVIVAIQTGEGERMAEIEKKIRYAVRGSQFDGQMEHSYPRWYIDVVVESPSKKGFYLVGELDGQYQYDAWDEKNGASYAPPILITVKNGKPFAVKIPESRAGWYDDITRRNHKLPASGPLRKLMKQAIKRRMDLEVAIDGRMAREVLPRLASKSINHSQANELRKEIQAEEFAKYKIKHLSEPRQITDDSKKFVTRYK